MSKPIQLTKPSDVLLQDLEGEAVLLHLAHGRYYGLDQNSFHMYRTLISSGTIEAACKALLQEYAVEPERLIADLDKFVAHLLENGLLIHASQETE